MSKDDLPLTAPRPRQHQSPADGEEEQIKASLRDVHSAIVNVAHAVGSIDIRSFEKLSANEIHAGLGPLTDSYLAKALQHTRTLFALCDQWEQKTAPGQQDHSEEYINRDFDFEIDKLVDDPGGHQSPRDNVADLAFIAKSELCGRQPRLQALSADDSPWKLLAEYDSALRRIQKSLAAVDYVLCKAEALPQCLDFQTELEVSLTVRSLYMRLRRSLTSSQAPTEENIYARLRSAGTQIAVLVGRDIYPLLRIRDRAQLRDIQDRILDWMRQERDNPLAGVRIWQDMLGVVDMFCQVSRRQELVTHDTAKVEQIHNALAEGSSSRLSVETLSLIKAIEGLDPEVDTLLASEEHRDAAAWLPAIERLRVHFGLAAPKAPPSFNLTEDEDFF